MDRDQFWSVDRLLPSIRSVSAEKKNSFDGVRISDLDPCEEKIGFGDRIVPKRSRVIHHYRLSEIKFPQDGPLFQSPLPSCRIFSSPIPCSGFLTSFSALTKEQKEYFFYFAQKTDEGIFVPTYFPYIQLYLCRRVRLDLPRKLLDDSFFRLWRNCRKEFPLADKLFSDTLSDFCLLCRSEPNYSALSSLLTLPDMRIRSFLMETFIFDCLFDRDHKLSPQEGECILRYLTAESFRKGKAYRFHSRFAHATEEAVESALKNGLFSRPELNRVLFRIQIPSQVKTVRRLFLSLPQEEIPSVTLLLCYYPFLHDENIRTRTDELIRYLENSIKRILKMKNCLSRIHISTEHRTFLDGILAGFEYLAPSEEAPLRGDSPVIEKEEMPIREFRVDFDDAAQIERDSWELTRSLTADYENSDEESVVIGENSDSEILDSLKSELNSLEKKTACGGEDAFWELAATLTETEDRFL